MIKAFLVGTGVLLVAQAMWGLILLQMLPPIPVVGLLWMGSPTIASFVAAFWAPRRKVTIGISMVVMAAVIFSMTNLGCEEIFEMRSDFHGIKGAVLVMFLTIAFNLIPCVLGAYVGRYLSED